MLVEWDMEIPMTDQEALLLELERLDSLTESSEYPLIRRANAEYYALPDEERLVRIRENLELMVTERIEQNSERVAAIFAEAGEPVLLAKIRLHMTEP